MFKLKHSDSILNFMLKTIQIHLMRIGKKSHKEKSVQYISVIIRRSVFLSRLCYYVTDEHEQVYFSWS